MAILLNYFWTVSVKAWKQVCTTCIIKGVGIRKPNRSPIIWQPRTRATDTQYEFWNDRAECGREICCVVTNKNLGLWCNFWQGILFNHRGQKMVHAEESLNCGKRKKRSRGLSYKKYFLEPLIMVQGNLTHFTFSPRLAMLVRNAGLGGAIVPQVFGQIS